MRDCQAPEVFPEVTWGRGWLGRGWDTYCIYYSKLNADKWALYHSINSPFIPPSTGSELQESFAYAWAIFCVTRVQDPWNPGYVWLVGLFLLLTVLLMVWGAFSRAKSCQMREIPWISVWMTLLQFVLAHHKKGGLVQGVKVYGRYEGCPIGGKFLYGIWQWGMGTWQRWDFYVLAIMMVEIVYNNKMQTNGINLRVFFCLSEVFQPSYVVHKSANGS